MIYASLNAEGQPYEIAPGAPFATHFVIVADDQEAAWSGVAIGERAPFDVNHPWTALTTYNADTLARFCIAALELPAPPDGEAVASYALTVTDGVIGIAATFGPIPPAPVPVEVSRGQAKQALLASGQLDQVEAAIAGASRQVQIYWSDFPTFHRDHPTLLTMAAALGMSSDDVDNLFRAAALVQ